MGGMIDVYERSVLDHFFGAQALSIPANWYLGLFKVNPADDGTGGTEVSGGSYARKAILNDQVDGWNAASTSGGISTKTNKNDIAFDQATADWTTGSERVVGWGLWDALAGTLRWTGKFLGTAHVFTAATSDVITSASHGFVDGLAVQVENENGALPAGLSAGTTYYVRDSTTHTFKVAATVGGAAIDITDVGSGTHTVSEDNTQPVLRNNIFTVPAGALVIGGD